jgi:hypothetical protein
MARTFQDEDLLLWEAYAAAPRAGAHRGARIMFHCLTDPSRRARVLERDEDRAAVEGRIEEAGETDLREMLAVSAPLA